MPMSFKKMNREAARKAKQQPKQEKRNERKQAATADKAITGTSANGSISPLKIHEGAMAGDLRAHHHRVIRG